MPRTTPSLTPRLCGGPRQDRRARARDGEAQKGKRAERGARRPLSLRSSSRRQKSSFLLRAAVLDASRTYSRRTYGAAATFESHGEGGRGAVKRQPPAGWGVGQDRAHTMAGSLCGAPAAAGVRSDGGQAARKSRLDKYSYHKTMYSTGQPRGAHVTAATVTTTYTEHVLHRTNVRPLGAAFLVKGRERERRRDTDISYVRRPRSGRRLARSR